MRMFLAGMLATMIAGCATVPNGEAVCQGSAAARTAHAAALVVDGGPQSKATGRTLIARIDAGCAR